jgi:glucose/arabinose dehydrogenase
VAIAIGVALVSLPASARSPYQISGTCAGLPRIQVKAEDGYCVGLVASGLDFPRGILALGPDRFLVADMGGREPNIGRLWQFDRDGKGFKRTALFGRLNQPHDLALGPDGWVYVGVAGNIKRFDPDDPAGTMSDVIGGDAAIAGPPGDGLHPLAALLFTSRKTLLVNGGSATNNCEGPKGEPPPQGVACPETRLPKPHGVVWEYTFDWNTGEAVSVKVLAEGLRNSLGLIEAKDGTLLQAENSRDSINDFMPDLADDEDLPPDEINVLVGGSHYGWPYCYGANLSSPDYPNFDCTRMAKPLIELPAHSAPLGMTYFDGGLLVALHGYRTHGHRIAKFAIKAQGMPEGALQDFVAGWDDGDTGPQGAPVDMEPMPDGSLLISEDRNGTILLLVRDR